MGKIKMCVIHDDKVCDGCGECDRCDLDPKKICDNCMKCLGDAADFRSIILSGIKLEEKETDAER